MSARKRILSSVLGVAVLLGVAAVQATDASASGHSTKITWTTAKVIRWSDGDTVVTTHGKVRLIGVDTPEIGRIGAATATGYAKRLAPVGSYVHLGNPASVQGKDRYGRYLRYVTRSGVDIGRYQIQHGAKARYDSRTGYDWHPRQSAYIGSDAAHRDYAVGKATKSTGTKAGSGTTCPKGYPVKGNDNSMIYHVPGQQFYKVTNARHCFSTTAKARSAGYRASKR